MKRIGLTTIGWTVLLLGIVMIPYPGPGWAVVFAGLFILSKEYHWARRLLAFTKTRYDAYTNWLKAQPLYIRSLSLIGTGLVVVLTLWLLNVYGMLASWLGVDWALLQSPLF